jgi:hypothetical protein
MDPSTKVFFEYINSYLLGAKGWDVVHRFLKHSTCQTRHNVAIEAYHGNLKERLKSMKCKLEGRRLDWLIHQLVGNLLIHY